MLLVASVGISCSAAGALELALAGTSRTSTCTAAAHAIKQLVHALSNQHPARTAAAPAIKQLVDWH
jgi:hypothetical protein